MSRTNIDIDIDEEACRQIMERSHLSTKREAVNLALRRLAGEPLTITMEILAGARDEHHLARLRGLLGRATMLPTGPTDCDEAAALYRRCRGKGETVRKLVDCLIAAVAFRAGAEVLHADADFAVLARHAALRVHASSVP